MRLPQGLVQYVFLYVFLNVQDITETPHRYGKDWVTFGLLAASLVSGLWLLFTMDLIHYRV